MCIVFLASGKEALAAADCGVAVDPWEIQLSTPMSLNRLWSDPVLAEMELSERRAEVIEEIVALGGMSCDGGLSCSAALVASLERLEREERAQRERQPEPGGPMCLPGDPDCTLTPGEPAGSHTLELTHPLAPYLDDAYLALRPATEPENLRRSAGEQRLFGREIVDQLDRPPRLT